MESYAVVINRHSAYMSTESIAEEMDISISQAYKLIRGIKKQIEEGRYNPYVVSGSRTNFYAVVDYNKYREQLIKGESCPPFNPREIAEVCGYCQEYVKMGRA